MTESIALHTRLKPGTEEAYAHAHANTRLCDILI